MPHSWKITSNNSTPKRKDIYEKLFKHHVQYLPINWTNQSSMCISSHGPIRRSQSVNDQVSCCIAKDIYTMNLVYIHGANATSESFNHIRTRLGTGLDLNYDSRDGFEHNLAQMQQSLAGVKQCFFIAHSLGGIYALHLSHHLPAQVLGAVTLSTPYGGAEVADYAQYFLPFSRLMRDIGPSSWAMREAAKIKVQHPWCNVVTVQGRSPFIVVANDGVVSIQSQRHHADMELIDVDYNHYEVVLAEPVIEIIRERINRITK